MRIEGHRDVHFGRLVIWVKLMFVTPDAVNMVRHSDLSAELICNIFQLCEQIWYIITIKTLRGGIELRVTFLLRVISMRLNSYRNLFFVYNINFIVILRPS